MNLRGFKMIDSKHDNTLFIFYTSFFTYSPSLLLLDHVPFRGPVDLGHHGRWFLLLTSPLRRTGEANFGPIFWCKMCKSVYAIRETNRTNTINTNAAITSPCRLCRVFVTILRLKSELALPGRPQTDWQDDWRARGDFPHAHYFA